MPINSKRWHRFFLFIAESGLVALVVFFLSAGWVLCSIWYEATVPHAPVPEGSQLLRTEPEIKEDGKQHYSCAIARCWYYATYSTSMPYEDVKTFYKGKYNALPFGVFWETVYAPINENDQPQPFTRLINDPKDRTIIILEISKTPWDRNDLFLVWFLSLPILLCTGLCFTTYRFYSRLKQK